MKNVMIRIKMIMMGAVETEKLNLDSLVKEVVQIPMMFDLTPEGMESLLEILIHSCSVMMEIKSQVMDEMTSVELKSIGSVLEVMSLIQVFVNLCEE